MSSDSNRPGKVLLQNGVYSAISSGITLIVTSIMTVVVARTLGPKNYGIYSMVLWAAGLFSWLVGMGLMQTVTKFIAELKENGTRKIASEIIVFILKLEVIVSIIVTIILILFREKIADYFFSPNESFYFFLAFLGLIPGIVTAVFSSAIEGIQKFKYFTLLNIIITPFAFFSKLFVLYKGYGIEGLLIVNFVFSLINVIYLTIVLKYEKFEFTPLSKKPSKLLRDRMKKYNLSVYSISIADKVIWDKSENFFLGRFCAAEQIGFYNLAYNFSGRIMNFLPSIFWRVLFPAMSSYFGSNDNSKIHRLFYVSSRYLAFFTFPLGAAGIVLSFTLMSVVYGRDFIAAENVLQIIFFSSMFGALSKPGSAILYGTEKQNFILKYGMVLAVINIALDLLLIKKYGAIGAAACNGIVTIFGAIGGLIYTCRKFKLDYPFYSVAKILFSTIIMAIVMRMIILQIGGIFGLALAIASGVFVYLISAIVLASFEDEDYHFLLNVRDAMPNFLMPFADVFIGFIKNFKKYKGD